MITTEYQINGSTDLTIAIVADLHEHEPSDVLSILREAKPDVIAVPGDLFENHVHGENLDKYDTSFVSKILCFCIHLADRIAGMRKRQQRDVKKEYAYRFLREASSIAPVLYSLGNHELYLTSEDRAVIEETGTVLLNNEAVEIGGIHFAGIPSKQCSGKIDTVFLEEFSNRPGYKVLLCHHPEYYEALAPYSDLILSGHCHGGQMRICGHGLFAPGQGLFPRFHHGVYGQMVVSSGCSNTASIPRLNNPCEIVIVKVQGKV